MKLIFDLLALLCYVVAIPFMLVRKDYRKLTGKTTRPTNILF